MAETTSESTLPSAPAQEEPEGSPSDLWERLDLPPPQGGGEGESVWERALHETLNYSEEPLPGAELEAFHACSSEIWIKGSVITSTLAVLASLATNPVCSLIIIAVGLYVTRQMVNGARKDFAWDVERRRGTDTRPAYESVEWLNHVVKSLWPILDPDLFAVGVDLLEDSLKTLSPAIVRTVRVSGVEQGTNALRLLGLRHLPDDIDITSISTLADPKEKQNGSRKDEAQVPLCKEAETADPGKFINVEARFAYRRLPPPVTKGANAHFLVHMGFGVKKLIKVEVPVWVELSGIVGVLRLRMEMISEPPFVRHVKFCFPHLPKVEIVAKPLGVLDVMTVPGVTSYVTASINTVLNYFVAPDSYTIDLSRFFLGSDVAMKTRSIGILCVVLHGAHNLGAADFDGKSDPFVEISLAHVGKVLYTSKIRPGELNPRWEEMAFIRVEVESLDEGDSLRLNVLDHDRYSRNDAMGSVLVPMKRLAKNSGEWHHVKAPLEAPRGGKHSNAGELSYSAAFFSLASLTPPPKKATKKKQHKTSDRDALPDISRPEEDSRSAEYAQRMREMLDGRSPASPSQRSGILAFQIHQLAELECKRSMTTRKKWDSLPSSYVRVVLNDELVFSSRVKPLSAAPYVNAASEVFCRDWTTARIDFAVMDYRDRDHDVLIGFVSLALGDLLSERSQVTKWLPVVGGEGHGRLRFSVLFKPLDVVLPAPLLEWGVGTMEIVSARCTGAPSGFAGKLSMEVEGGASASTSSVEAEQCGSSSERQLAWPLDEPLRIPILTRASPVHLSVASRHTLMRTEELGWTALWLSLISGEDDVSLKLSLNSPDAPRIPPPPPLPVAADVRGKKKPEPSDLAGAQQHPNSSDAPISSTATSSSSTSAPTLHLTIRWRPGLGPAHRDIILSAPTTTRAAYQLSLHRLEFEAKQRDAEDDGEGAEKEWVEDRTGTPRLQSVAHVRRKAKRLKQQGGTMKWMAHGVHLASRKIRGSTKHNVRGPAPAEEIQSAL